MSMQATCTFKCASRPSKDPLFVDQCLDLIEFERWRDTDGPPTLHFWLEEGGLGLVASFAWRGDLFAYGFPVAGTREQIILTRSAKRTADNGEYYNTRGVLAALMDLLEEHLKKQEREGIEQAGRAQDDQKKLGRMRLHPN